MRNDTERELFFSKSPKAVGVMFIMKELWWDLIVPSFVCVCVCVHLLQAPEGPSLFYLDKALCEGAGSSAAVELTLLKQCIDFWELVNTEEKQRMVPSRLRQAAQYDQGCKHKQA